MSIDRKGATEFTTEAHVHDVRCLDFEDQASFEEASRGLIAPVPEGQILADDGQFVFDPSRLAFAAGDAEQPDTVNPSLWRQARLYSEGGLFEVCERIYQVRNLDISNITFIEGDTGLIVVESDAELVGDVATEAQFDTIGRLSGTGQKADAEQSRGPQENFLHLEIP